MILALKRSDILLKEINYNTNNIYYVKNQKLYFGKLKTQCDKKHCVFEPLINKNL